MRPEHRPAESGIVWIQRHSLALPVASATLYPETKLPCGSYGVVTTSVTGEHITVRYFTLPRQPPFAEALPEPRASGRRDIALPVAYTHSVGSALAVAKIIPLATRLPDDVIRVGAGDQDE